MSTRNRCQSPGYANTHTMATHCGWSTSDARSGRHSAAATYMHPRRHRREGKHSYSNHNASKASHVDSASSCIVRVPRAPQRTQRRIRASVIVLKTAAIMVPIPLGPPSAHKHGAQLPAGGGVWRDYRQHEVRSPCVGSGRCQAWCWGWLRCRWWRWAACEVNDGHGAAATASATDDDGQL